MTGGTTYSAFGLSIRSDIEFSELDTTGRSPEVVIRRAEVPRGGCQPTLRNEMFFLPHAAGFHVRDGSEIIVDVYPGADPVAVRRMLLGYAMAALLRQRGWLTLHGSAVVVQGEGVLFLGASGTGKSTTAAAFHAKGELVVADDLAPVRVEDGKCVLCPGLTWVRLLPDAHGVLPESNAGSHEFDGKKTFPLTPHSTDRPVPVSGIYLLEEGTRLESIEIPPMAAVALLRRHAQLRTRRLKEDILNQHLSYLTAVAKAAQVRRLVRPRSIAGLADLVAMVRDEVAARAGGPALREAGE